MTAIIVSICILVTAAVGATAFILGRQVGYTQRNAEHEKERAKALEEQVAVMDMEYRQLQVQYEQERKDNAGGYTRPGSWDPGQLNGRG